MSEKRVGCRAKDVPIGGLFREPVDGGLFLRIESSNTNWPKEVVTLILEPLDGGGGLPAMSLSPWDKGTPVLLITGVEKI